MHATCGLLQYVQCSSCTAAGAAHTVHSSLSCDLSAQMLASQQHALSTAQRAMSFTSKAQHAWFDRSMPQHACTKHIMTAHAGAEHGQHTIDREASRRAVGTVPRGAAVAEGHAVDEGPMGGLRLHPAVDAAAAGGCNALNLLHASISLKLGLQHILQTFCTRAACQPSSHSASDADGLD